MSQPLDKHNKGHDARLDVPELLWDFPSFVHLAAIPQSGVLHPSRIPEVKHLSTSSLGGSGGGWPASPGRFTRVWINKEAEVYANKATALMEEASASGAW